MEWHTPPDRASREDIMHEIEQAPQVGIGLIGSGFMGRAHALAFRNVGGVFPLARQPRLELLADHSEQHAAAAAASLGFRRATGDWTALVQDPAVDIVAIATPNRLHAPMALAAIAAGKHVYCEKPLATTLADAIAMTRAAASAGIDTVVGFNYLKNPLIATAREIVRSGEIGTVTGFRGIHAEDFMADPASAVLVALRAGGGGRRAGRHRQPHPVDGALPAGRGGQRVRPAGHDPCRASAARRRPARGVGRRPGQHAAALRGTLPSPRA